MSITIIFTLIVGIKSLNDARKSVEACRVEHLADDLTVTDLCLRHGDKIRRTIMYGVFAIVLGAIMIWSLYGPVTAIQIVSTIAILSGATCKVISWRLDFHISRYRRRLESSDLHA